MHIDSNTLHYLLGLLAWVGIIWFVVAACESRKP